MSFLSRVNTATYFSIAVLLALLAGYWDHPKIYAMATIVSELFINLLKLISIPIIFLSIVSTLSGMDNAGEIKSLGRSVVKYTLLTTIIAAAIALTIFVLVDPVRSQLGNTLPAVQSSAQEGYLTYLVQSIPSNIIQPFSDSHVIGVLFIAILFSMAILTLPTQNRVVLHTFFSSLYAAVMKITGWIVRLMPWAIWGFITLFIKDMREGLDVKNVAYYLCCIIAANLIQGLIVLPIFLKAKGISPVHLFKAMWPALSLAFFTKSSSAALPLAIKCAQERGGVSAKVSNFSFPLCTTINMNACAAFILITVLFVSMSNGMVFSPIELGVWVLIATIAAVGNAGVPMGCYFLSSAFLVSMNVPLNILGIILPFYSLIDMLESAINVWSDSCVAAVVDVEASEKTTLSTSTSEKVLEVN